MARPNSLHQLQQKDYFILGLHKVMSEKNAKVLRKVLQWGTPRRNQNKNFYDYQFTVKKISSTEYRKKFNKSQREKMESDSQIDSFDVSLLYLCIQYGCDGLAPPKDPRWVDREDTLERHLTSVKTHRNDFMHDEYEINEQNFLDKIEEIRNLLNNIIEKAAKHFKKNKKEMKQFLKEINNELNQIRDQTCNAFPSSFLYDKLSILLKIEGRIELQRKYKAESSMNPISNLIGKQKVEVKKIFTKIEINKTNGQELLPVDKLFEFVDRLNSGRNLLLVEGVAGAGKTTLTRLILHEWSERSSNMKNLDNYDLAIWTECRDGGTPSLAHLLHSLMPIATQKIQGDAQVVKSIQKNELLFIVDGLDELNASSETVFKEILTLMDIDIITIICTTRPNKVSHIKKYVPETFEIQHLKITGIAEQDRADFVINYSQALEDQKGTGAISGLPYYLKRRESRLQDHWRLPFNLVLVTILWLQNPDNVNEMTTTTELFLKTVELCKKRLIQRLQDNAETSRLSTMDIDENVDDFLRALAYIAFTSHCEDQTILSQKSVHYLKVTCHSKNLPPEEVLSSFLVQAGSLTNKNQEKFNFPHKGLQDFFCAKYIQSVLEYQEKPVVFSRIFSFIENILDCEFPRPKVEHIVHTWKNELDKILGESSNINPTVRSILEDALKGDTVTNTNQVVQLDLTKWKNVLVHLTGLLHHQGRSLTDERTEEMVKLLEEGGMTDSNDWFDFLSNVKCDAAISKHIVLRGRIQVTDTQVEAFLKVLDCAELDRLDLKLEGDPSATPCVEELLVALKNKNWELALHLHHDFRFPKKVSCILDGTLRELFRSNLRLIEFKGQLSASALKALPSSVVRIWLSVKDGAHYKSLIPIFTSKKKTRPTLLHHQLADLYIHVPVDIDESSVRPLPKGPLIYLFVSEVEEATAKKASVLATTLLPSKNRYLNLRSLSFPGVGRTPRLCERLLQELESRGVQVGIGACGRVVVSPLMDKEEERRMETLAEKKLNCYFLTYSEDDIWITDRWIADKRR